MGSYRQHVENTLEEVLENYIASL